MIYLDNNATTPIESSVAAVMERFIGEEFGNPSSSHRLGKVAKEAVQDARRSVAELVGAASEAEIYFTSSGTESDNWAILGAIGSSNKPEHFITTAVEHEAVRKTFDRLERSGHEVTRLSVNEEGHLDLDELRRSLRSNTFLVSVMMANNETGVMFPIKEVSEMIHSESSAVFHVDAVNAAGKVPIDVYEMGVDLLSISAHKFQGPKGSGALFVREGIQIEPFLVGGGQERGMRAGTEAVHQIVGLGAAAEIAKDMEQMDRIRKLRDLLENKLISMIPHAYVNGTQDSMKRLPNTTNISFRYANGEIILHLLDECGIFVSTGSACNAYGNEPSPVLVAMNVPYSRAMGSIRFSLGRQNSLEDISRVLDVMPEIVKRARSLAK
ncbi:cysteine desulfurase family protein [Leptolyngbya sp. 7M]|uniref:cysteine desulfurase family protein n=1 Tax=Leptolyngbya sp. 7M TaxID=2812896 RepID=UPI001B8B4306|nr:cysteine desulfurase family protein [Leptolyngbya sp. 7M]QYO66935.1 cysteine desulfurase [Leptolyngbya sp. 7M]